jgi:hypothetical protein
MKAWMILFLPAFRLCVCSTQIALIMNIRFISERLALTMAALALGSTRHQAQYSFSGTRSPVMVAAAPGDIDYPFLV